MPDCPTPLKTGRFASKATARAAADRLRAVAPRSRLRPYRCVCGTYHLAPPLPLTARIRAALGGPR